MKKITEQLSKQNNIPRVLLNERGVADILDVSVRTLQTWRYKGGGPKFISISHRCVRYRPEDVEAFLDSRARVQTSE